MLCGEGVVDILIEYSDVMSVIIPELAPCIGFDQNNPYHMYTVYDHIAHAVGNYKGSDISVKMALLLHDIAKPSCYTEDERGGHFYCHGVFGKFYAEKIVERLKFDNKTKSEIIDLVQYHDADIYPGVKTVRRWMNKIGPELLDKLLYVKLADIEAHHSRNRKPLRDRVLGVKLIAKNIIEEQQCFRIKDLAVNGRDIMNLGIEPGPTVGKVLNHLLTMVIDGFIENEYGPLIAEASRYLYYDERETNHVH
jgi:tRNA nucleotidyltransferase (CCA-adding enzyme)